MVDTLYYFYLLKVNINAGESNFLQEFLENLNPDQQEILQSHFVYMEQLKKEKKILLGGPCVDASNLVFILRVGSEAEADKLISSDPTIQSKICTVVEKHQFHPAIISDL